MERLVTGIGPLDAVLHGGIPSGASILLTGSPGSGKTILAHQIAYNNAGPGCKVLYLTTMSEPQVKIMKFQQEFTFFDIGKFQQSVVYYDMACHLRSESFSSVLAVMDELVKKHQPKIIIIDTIKTMADMIPSKSEFRKFILDISLHFSIWECTSFFIGEYTEDEISIRPESAIADGIIYLSGTEEKKYQKRFLRILKMRGTGYENGETYFKITKDGLKLFPKLNLDVNGCAFDIQFSKRLSFGIPGLDNMIGGGIPCGTATIVSGGAGTGKTLIAARFAYEGLIHGESAVYATFEENPGQFLYNMKSIGMDMGPYIENGRLHLIYQSPVELDMDEHITLIQEYVRDYKASRIVLDSISSYELGMTDKIKYTDYIWALANYFKAMGVTSILTHEIHGTVNIAEFTKHGVSFVADNLILVYNREAGTDVKRYMRVVKMRSSRHDTSLREYRISCGGIELIQAADCEGA